MKNPRLSTEKPEWIEAIQEARLAASSVSRALRFKNTEVVFVERGRLSKKNEERLSSLFIEGKKVSVVLDLELIKEVSERINDDFLRQVRISIAYELGYYYQDMLLDEEGSKEAPQVEDPERFAVEYADNELIDTSILYKNTKKGALYNEVIELLPNWCANVTDIADLRKEDLETLLGDFTVFSKNNPVKRLKGAPDQECHAVAAHLWHTNPGYKLVCGLAYSEERTEDLSSWHFHSFCIDTDGVIVEPTPIVRDWYVGSVLTEEQARKSYKEELENIRNLFPKKEKRKVPGLK